MIVRDSANASGRQSAVGVVEAVGKPSRVRGHAKIAQHKVCTVQNRIFQYKYVQVAEYSKCAKYSTHNSILCAEIIFLLSWVKFLKVFLK